MKTGKLLRIGLGIPLALLALLALTAGYNLIATAVEKKQNPPPGQVVEIDGKHMHLYRRGTGEHTVVLLGGWGTPGPVYDFMPLMRRLETKHTVVCVEGFGYGWSDQTKTPRSNQAVVDEIRGALQAMNLAPPYILMPHSLGGIYALYWANAHPEELELIVGLDISNPAQIEFISLENGINWFGLLRNSGLGRIALALFPALLPAYPDEMPEDHAGQRMMTLWNLNKSTVLREGAMIRANSLELKGKQFPASVPVRLLVAQETIDAIGTQFPGQDWLGLQRQLIAGHPDAGIIVVEGSHYIHHGNAELIRGLTP